MSLNWSIKTCQNPEALQEEGEWPMTEVFIWQTMSVGIGRITEENAPEFYARLKMWEAIVGDLFQRRNTETGKWEYVGVSFDDVKKRIGLSTNVTTISRSEWLKSVSKYISREADDWKRSVENKVC
jgi:hypothetical protein